MCSRVYCNIYNVLNIYYLVAVLEFTTLEEIQFKPHVIVAIIPLILYLSSTICSS